MGFLYSRVQHESLTSTEPARVWESTLDTYNNMITKQLKPLKVLKELEPVVKVCIERGTAFVKHDLFAPKGVEKGWFAELILFTENLLKLSSILEDEEFTKLLTEHLTIYVSWFLFIIQNNGARSAAKQFKLQFAFTKKLLVSSEPPDPLPFLSAFKSTTKGGKVRKIPVRLNTINSLLQAYEGKPQHISVIVSTLQIANCLVSDGKAFDTLRFIKTLSAPGKVPSSKLLEEISSCSEHIFETRYTQSMCEVGPALYLSSRQGVHSQAYFSLLPEMIDIKKRPELESHITSFLKAFGNAHLIKLMNTASGEVWDPKHPLKFRGWLRRMTILNEPGFKERPITVADNATQSALLPLHDFIMKLLKKIDRDGTFRAQEIWNIILARTKDENHFVECLDLESFTENLELTLQIAVLKPIIGEDLTNSWVELMREPLILKGKKASFGRGQPMGILSSWAVATLTHHVLLKVAARRIKRKADYYLLGDDIVIFGQDLSKSYRDLMNEIGMPISLAKSLKSEESGLEFCKRLAFKGIEISPVPFNILVQKDKELQMAELYRLLLMRWPLVSTLRFVECWFRYLNIDPSSSRAKGIQIYLGCLHKNRYGVFPPFPVLSGWGFGMGEPYKRLLWINKGVQFTEEIRKLKLPNMKMMGCEFRTKEGKIYLRPFHKCDWFRGYHSLALYLTTKDIITRLPDFDKMMTSIWENVYNKEVNTEVLQYCSLNVDKHVVFNIENLSYMSTDPASRFLSDKKRFVKNAIDTMEYLAAIIEDVNVQPQSVDAFNAGRASLPLRSADKILKFHEYLNRLWTGSISDLPLFNKEEFRREDLWDGY